mmetsp:Transcript_40030/g.69302  ORF Transcript_40030/g.69302 Transcript_40030/m.69302 type:complete len:430 (-) Transcript_40030:149-1438(-)
MKSILFSALIGFVLYARLYFAAEEEQDSMVNIKAQRAAVKAWAESLQAKDYDPSDWAKTHHWQPANFFEFYASKLSDIFVEKGAKVNFALVGACDGTNDRTIRDKFLKNEHWRGVFVEPFSMNYKDLSNYMETHKVSHRAHLIHAAATSKCTSPTIKMKRPTFEEKNSSLPHWMRRQIGAVVPLDKLNNKMTGGWVAEFTRCVSGPEILQDWTDALNHQTGPTGNADTEGEEGDKKRKKGMIKKLRPHVLKVDVEGHDYDVLMGFLGDEMTQSMLPLMINFEAKSISKQFAALRDTMEKRGYVVSHFATDGFALLRADAINRKPTKVISSAGADTATNNLSGGRNTAAEEEGEGNVGAGDAPAEDAPDANDQEPKEEEQDNEERPKKGKNKRKGKGGGKRRGAGGGGKGGGGKGGKAKRARANDDAEQV